MPPQNRISILVGLALVHCFHTSALESGFFAGAHRAVVLRVRIGDEARCAGGQHALAETADQGRAVTTVDHIGFADQLIDAAGPRGMNAQSVVRPDRRIIALNVCKRTIVRRDDELVHGADIEITADELELLACVAPPFNDVRLI